VWRFQSISLDLEIGVVPSSVYNVVVKRKIPSVPDRNHSQANCVRFSNHTHARALNTQKKHSKVVYCY